MDLKKRVEEYREDIKPNSLYGGKRTLSLHRGKVVFSVC